jgi:hypothetical protein
MRVVAELASNRLVRVQHQDPTVGALSTVNGQFVVPIPEGAAVTLAPASYLTPQNAGSVPGQAAAALLARYPMYSNIAFNYLLEASDVAALDLAATGPSGEITRAMVGRGAGVSTGIAPNSTVILPINNVAAGPPRPGCLVTDTIDIGPATGGAGAEEALLWWSIADFSTSEDVLHGYGTTAGLNAPTLRSLVETSQTPAGLTVSVSNDDGATWFTAPRLTPVNLGVFDTDVRVAFVNTSPNRVYLLAFAVLF